MKNARRPSEKPGAALAVARERIAELEAENARLVHDQDTARAGVEAAMDAQRQAEQEFRRLIEESPMAVYIDTPEGTQYISPRVVEMFGYLREAWPDPAFWESILHPDDRERVMAQSFREVAQTSETYASEFRIIALDGRRGLCGACG